MNKLYLAILPMALVGFAAAVVDLKDKRVLKLLQAQRNFLEDNEHDFFRVEYFSFSVDDDFQTSHLKCDKINDDASGSNTTEFVCGITAAVAYQTWRGKHYPLEAGIESKDGWMTKMNEKVVGPCKKVVTELEPFVQPVKEMNLDFTPEKSPHTLEMMETEMLKKLLYQFDVCERVLSDTEHYGDLSYQVAQENKLI